MYAPLRIILILLCLLPAASARAAAEMALVFDPGASRIDEATLSSFLWQLPPEARIALFRAGKMEPALPFARAADQSSQEIIESLRHAVTQKGATNPLPTVASALAHLRAQNRPESAKALILFGGEEANHSVTQWKALAEEAEQSRVSLFWFHGGEAPAQRIQEWLAAGGGAFLSSENAASLKSGFRRIARKLTPERTVPAAPLPATQAIQTTQPAAETAPKATATSPGQTEELASPSTSETAPSAPPLQPEETVVAPRQESSALFGFFPVLVVGGLGLFLYRQSHRERKRHAARIRKWALPSFGARPLKEEKPVEFRLLDSRLELRFSPQTIAWNRPESPSPTVEEEETHAVEEEDAPTMLLTPEPLEKTTRSDPTLVVTEAARTLPLPGKRIDPEIHARGGSLMPALIDYGRATGKPLLPLTRPVILVGRGGASEAPAPGAVQLVVPREEISRRHALLRFQDHAFWVEDLGSSNGTFLNGRRLTAPVRLKHGDVLRFGECQFGFVLLNGHKTQVTSKAA